MEKAEEEAKEKKKELEAELKKNQEESDKALAEVAKAFKKAKKAADAAHKAAEEARKKQEELQIAEHKKLMADRKAKFESRFRNVWAAGPTGVSMAHLTVESQLVANDLIMKLFQKTMIADVTDYQHDVSRRYLANGKMSINEAQHGLIMITSDDRIPELIEAVAASQVNKTSNPGYFDLVVTPLATGSVEYIKWVKEQTMKVLADEPAFFNQKAKTEVKPLTDKVEDKKDDDKKDDDKKSDDKKDDDKKADAPAAETKKDEAKADAPKADAPKADAPKADAPKADAKTESKPKADEKV